MLREVLPEGRSQREGRGLALFPLERIGACNA
jgi:hypothetical protein